jgi:tRNA (cytidine/uridine-2'-O-)-methyltransferase
MQIALYKPEIPPNTGNIARLSVCTGSRLHIIGKPNFSMDDAAVRRAGLDYWHLVDLHLHEDWETFLLNQRQCAETKNVTCNILLISKFGKRYYTDYRYNRDDILVFGQESSGLPEFIHDSIRKINPDHILRIPVTSHCRSLNLANAVAVTLFESLRQQSFPNLSPEPHV